MQGKSTTNVPEHPQHPIIGPPPQNTRESTQTHDHQALGIQARRQVNMISWGCTLDQASLVQFSNHVETHNPSQAQDAHAQIQIQTEVQECQCQAIHKNGQPK